MVSAGASGKSCEAIGKNLQALGANPGDRHTPTPGGSMLTSVRRTGVASLALTAFVTTAGATGLGSPALAAEGHHHHHGPGTVFVQTDDPTGNTVVAYDRAADGRLTQAGTYATGGLGGVLDGSVVDHLASQGSLALDRRHHTL